MQKSAKKVSVILSVILIRNTMASTINKNLIFIDSMQFMNFILAVAVKSFQIMILIF